MLQIYFNCNDIYIITNNLSKLLDEMGIFKNTSFISMIEKVLFEILNVKDCNIYFVYIPWFPISHSFIQPYLVSIFYMQNYNIIGKDLGVVPKCA